MKDSLGQLLIAAATLAGNLAGTSVALAAEPTLAQAAVPSLAMSSSMTMSSLAMTGAALAPYLLPPLALPSESMRAASDMERLFAEPAPAPVCQKSCGAGEKKAPKLADDLLNELGTLPVLGAVMTPVTRGLLIPTGEGAPPLQLAVVPTRITRGSGFVAIARF